MASAKVKKQLSKAVTTKYDSEDSDTNVEEENDDIGNETVDKKNTDTDDDDDGGDGGGDGGGDDDSDGNAGWADSIAKVLNTTKPKTSKKSVVLSRAKKIDLDKATEKKPSYDFEIDGEMKEKPVKEEPKATSKKKPKNLQLSLRVRPSWQDIERERHLRKIATKGVVQLFNAVRMQQKDLNQQLEKAGPLDSRKDAVLNNINKKKFLDVLMSGNRAKSEAVDNSVKIEKKEESSSSSESDDTDDENAPEKGKKRKSEWNVLRPDFMTNKKIKHWDEDADSDNSDENQNESNDEDDEDEDE